MRISTNALVLIAFATFGAAIAQDPNFLGIPDVPGDPALWFSDPAIGVLAIVGLVKWIRGLFTDANGDSRIDGPIVVPALAIAVGVASGLVGSLMGFITYEPFASWGLAGGLAYGAALGVTGVLGVNIFELLASKLGAAIVGLVSGRGGGEVSDASSPRTDASSSRLRS